MLRADDLKPLLAPLWMIWGMLLVFGFVHGHHLARDPWFPGLAPLAGWLGALTLLALTVYCRRLRTPLGFSAMGLALLIVGWDLLPHFLYGWGWPWPARAPIGPGAYLAEAGGLAAVFVGLLEGKRQLF